MHFSILQTFLDVLAEMEKMERLGEDNLNELENVLSRCSKDLAYRVQRFKANGTRNPVRISTTGNSVSPSLSTNSLSISLSYLHPSYLSASFIP